MDRPAPAYLLLGPESGGKAKKIQEIRRLCTEFNGGQPPELHRFYPFETEEGQIMEPLQNTSLFADHRLVILSEADSCKAPLYNLITSYLKNPSDSATLLIISAQNRVHASIHKMIGKEQTFMFWELFANQKKDWIIQFFRSGGVDISLEAVDLLLSMIENNTQEMRLVSSQLIAYVHSAHEGDQDIEVTEDDVEAFIFHSRQESVFTLFEKIAAGDLSKTMEVLRSLQLGRDADPTLLFGGLLWQFRRLHSFLLHQEEDSSESEAFAKATVLGKSSAIRGKHNQFIYRSAAEHYNLQQVQQIITAVCDAETYIRELGTAIQPLITERLMHTIIIRKGTPVRREDSGVMGLRA